MSAHEKGNKEIDKSGKREGAVVIVDDARHARPADVLDSDKSRYDIVKSLSTSTNKESGTETLTMSHMEKEARQSAIASPIPDLKHPKLAEKATTPPSPPELVPTSEHERR